MRKGKRMRKERKINESLLHAIYKLQSDWKNIESFHEKSIDPSNQLTKEKELAQARYMFLLQEARHRKLSAIKYKK